MHQAAGMSSVYRFEDLRVWQAAKRLSDELPAISARSGLRTDAALRDQLNRAALSTVANIAEGFLRRSNKEFIQYLRIADGSNGEARALLHAAKGRQLLADAEYDRLVGLTSAISAMLRALRNSLGEPQRPRTKN